MTVIGLCGLEGCGKGIVAQELVSHHGFKCIYIRDEEGASEVPSSTLAQTHLSAGQGVFLGDAKQVLDYVTSNWKQNFVVANFKRQEEFEELLKRPFFMVVAVLAPLQQRALRRPGKSLADLAQSDDNSLYAEGLAGVISAARLTISNGGSLDGLRSLVRSLPLLDERWIRPDWDAYFMEMAELASRRSNCMKRCVGAVIVRDRRVVATGYNGTARGLVNCRSGGCPRCNGNARCGVDLEHCYCLHAEANALMEAGRSRAEGGTLYCSTAPCLGCSQKIVQCGILRIVYAREYSIDHNASAILCAGGVQLDKFVHQFPHYVNTPDA